MKVLWISGMPEEVRAVHPVTDVPSAAWSWIIGHLPPPKDVELHILCPVFGMKEKECHFEHDGAHWHCFRLKRFEPIFLRYRFYLGIRKFVKGLNPDVIHGWGGESGCGLLATYCSPYAVVGVQGLLRMLDANARRWKVEIPERGSVSAWVRRKFEKFAYRRANRLVVEGEASQASLMALYGLPSRIVPHPLRREFLADDSDLRKKVNGEVRFLFVGQLTARKGAMDSVYAFAELGDVHARLTIVGSGEQGGQIDDFVARRGLQGRVERKTVCSADGLREMMDASDVIVVPSYGDTGPTVLKEALARGLYPIGYDNTGVSELVSKYGYGRVVETGDTKALSLAMKNCVLDDGAGVMKRVQSDLSLETAWRGLREVYGSLSFEVPAQIEGAMGQRIRHFARMIHGDSPVVISFHTGIRQNLFAICKAKIAGRAVVREINEWPLSVTWKESRLKQWIEIHILPKFFDGAICISDVLLDFWKLHGRKNAHLLKIPMTVDVSEIDEVKAQKTDVPYVCYAGGLTEEKDGVETLKKAFSIVKETHPEVELRIVNGVSHDEAVSIMKSASCLVLARPDSLQARAGFPTKLGEYLATGRPVVVTKTGEIGRYLEDGKTAFLVAPGDAEKLAVRINAALSNLENANAIGAAGRRVALECFDWHMHKEELIRWLKQFK